MNAMQPVYESIQKHPWFEGMKGYQILGLSLYVGEYDLRNNLQLNFMIFVSNFFMYGYIKNGGFALHSLGLQLSSERFFLWNMNFTANNINHSST